jgi:quercetin 2,3-dioxygenase
MKEQSKATMLMASNRISSETETFRSHRSLGSRGPADPDLICWQDDVIAGGIRIPVKPENDAILVLIPVVGSIVIWVGEEQICEVDSGQLFLLPVLEGEEIFLLNPYPNAMVNILHGRIRSKLRIPVPVIRSFNLDDQKGRLLDLSTEGLPLFMGKFSGRQEALLDMPEDISSMFIFVIQGAFELQYRLLESRDGMILWETEQLEMEALSNDAIILMIGLGR